MRALTTLHEVKSPDIQLKRLSFMSKAAGFTAQDSAQPFPVLNCHCRCSLPSSGLN